MNEAVGSSKTSPTTPAPGLICFGSFEVDVRAGELRRSGIKIKLSGQPFDVLVALLEKPGQVITREELRDKLWAQDTFVDFEQGLNKAINKLREALGDDADNPRFIETIPRKGYRFIAPRAGPLAKDVATPERIKMPESPVSKGSTRRIALFGAGVVLVLVSVDYWRSQTPTPVVTNVVRITNDGKPKNPINTPVSDGVHLYFTEGVPDTTGSAIAQVSGAGGETTLMPATQNVLAVISVSPDRSQLLFSRSASVGSDSVVELWIQPLPAGTPHRVGSINALLANWTPDGSQVVYADGNSIMVANKDGSESHQLAKLPGLVFGIRYSPDGRRIRVDVTDAKTDTNWIWEMDADGGNIHRFLPKWGGSPEIGAGCWSPDGKYYYFLAGRGDSKAIWVMPENDSIFRRNAKGPSRLMSGPLFSSPVPSGDGKRLFVIGQEPRIELQRYDLQGQRFDPYLQGISAGPVDFSPDRKWVAYVSYPEMTLWVSRVDGRDKMQLTFSPVRAYLPRWSPDGSQILFIDVRFNSPSKIYSVSPSGGRPEQLVLYSDGYEADPTWTPDGSSIIFGRVDKLGAGAIYRLNWETKEVSSIPDSDRLFSPRVSPDGRYISALSLNQANLMLFDTEKKRWSKLAVGDNLGYNEWSHDGKYVYFRQKRGGAGELARVKISDHSVGHILSLKDFPQPSDPYAFWIGLTPDDAPLLMRDRSIQEIYALNLELR